MPSRKSYQLLPFIDVQGQGLLDKNVLPCQERSPAQIKVLDRWSCNRNGLDLRHVKQIVEALGSSHRIGLSHFFPTCRVHLANCFQAAKLVEIAHQISAPVTATHNSNPWHLPIHDRVPLFHRLVGAQAQLKRQLLITMALVVFQIEFGDGLNDQFLLRLR
jgi:hypothetical protein